MTNLSNDNVAQRPKYALYLATFPEYRNDFVSFLIEHEKSIALLCSNAQLDKSVKTGLDKKLYTRVKMIRVLGFFYFQIGGWRLANAAETLVIDLNPRSLTALGFLIFRKMQGKRTLVWGHLFPRAGKESRSNVVRQAMRKFADGFIAYTPMELQQATEISPGRKAWVAPNSLYLAEKIRVSQQDLPRNLVIYVGRLAKAKKVLNLIQGFYNSGLASEGIELYIVGDGEDRDSLEKYVEQHDLGNSVTFTGWVSDFEKLESLYARTFVSASPGFAGLGLTQSLGFGVPQVISMGERHSPEIELADTGGVFWSESSSHVDFANALVTAWENRTNFPSIEIAQIVRSRYSAELMAAGFLAALHGD